MSVLFGILGLVLVDLMIVMIKIVLEWWLEWEEEFVVVDDVYVGV